MSNKQDNAKTTNKLYQAVRGTKDIFFQDLQRFNLIKDIAFKTTAAYGFTEAITPIFEFIDIFKGLGEESDVVNKEMYLLQDRNGEQLVLRPEGTAPLVRMLVSNGLTHKLPLKLSYWGPMFRYERPQKGRQRQFYQFGVEHFNALTPSSDVAMLLMAQQLLSNLRIQSFTLEVNFLGTSEEQQAYASKLQEYLQDYVSQLSEDSQRRLKSNPLRILDSKAEQDKILLQRAPKIIDSLGVESKEYFEKIKEILAELGMNFVTNPHMVRGLDYYTGLVFEFTTEALGSQNTLLAGGRYNNLVKKMGGPDVASIGFAAGVERLALAMPHDFYPPLPKKVAVLALDEKAQSTALRLLQSLSFLPQIPNENQLSYFLIEEGAGLAKKLKKANKISADFALVLGEQELANNNLLVKDLSSGKQQTCALNKVEEIRDYLLQKKPF